MITATFDELLAEQIEAYPHKDTYDSATEDLKVTTQELRAHAYGLTGGIHEYRTKARKSYAAATGLRIEPLIGLLGAPKAGKLFAAIPPFRTEQMMYVLGYLTHPSPLTPSPKGAFLLGQA